MVDLIATATIVVRTVILVLGAVITHLSYRAAVRTGSPAIRAVALAFGCMTLGAILGGGLDQLLGLGLAVSLLAQSILTAIGFAVLVYSLYLGDHHETTAVRDVT